MLLLLLLTPSYTPSSPTHTPQPFPSAGRGDHCGPV